VSYILNPYRFAAAVDSDYVVATGGTITTEGNYKVHTFLAEGTDFIITDAGSSSGSDTFDYLVVAGGGGGGVGWSTNITGGGGGAGGYNYVTGQAAAEQTYSVTIGAGGAGSSSGTSRGSNGSNTQLGSFTAMSGGGGGGSFAGDSTSNFAYLSGADGGSGGGASVAGTDSADGRGGSASDAAYGNDGGGVGVYIANSGCGGGGKGATGNTGTASNGAAGGAGEANSISFTSTTYAGGGGGSGYVSAGAGGSGGGGAGGTETVHATAGTENRGGGGGGGGEADTDYDGAAGGKGLIVCRYRTSHDYIEAEGGTVTTSGDYKLHTFTGDGGFAITNAGTASGSNTFDYAVYGGGAGGGSGSGAGGGGGGYRTATGIASSETTVAVTVGGGGTGNTDQLEAGGDGTPSSYAQAGSQEFFDVSSNGHVITTAGHTVYSTTTKKIGNASVYFDGTGDYLSVATSADFPSGTGEWTVECWYQCKTRQAATIMGQQEAAGGTGSTSWIIWQGSDGTLTGYFSDGGGSWDYSTAATSALTVDTWYHIAVVRSGDVITIYIDGTSAVSVTLSSGFSMAQSTQPITIGSNVYSGTPANPIDGYLDQIRVSKGIARYTTDFTPVEEPFIDDSYTKLLIEPEFTTASTLFFDDSGSSHTITTGGDTAYSSRIKKIGNASIDFDGTGDSLSIPSSSDFGMGTGAFTIEFWVNFRNLGSYHWMVGAGDVAAANKFDVAWFDTNLLYVYVNGTAYTFSWTPAEDTWYHVAATRSGTDLRAFIDGSQIGSTASSSDSVPTIDLIIGRQTSAGTAYALDGYLDQIRISNTARYTGNFTAPTTAFTSDINTKLLIQPTLVPAGAGWQVSAGGGGGGGTYGVDDGDGTSSADGSGGGASTYYDDYEEDTYSGAGGTGGSYGNNGGVASVDEGDSGYYLYPNGGGGGAGGVGGDGSYDSLSALFSGGDGGIGAKPSWLTNLRGGGGGGGCDSDSTASPDTGQGGTGYGGGGDGGYASVGVAGTANYGAGGGGGSWDSDGTTDYDGGDGGSGIVVFRYKYK
jgi:hypothetical protein